MKTLTRLSKKAVAWCELMNYDVEKIKENMRSDSFAVQKCETVEEMDFEGVDKNFPYVLWNPYNYAVEKKH